MKKIIAVALLFTTPALAQTQSYYGSDGSYQGQSIREGNTRTYYGADGGYAGQSIDNGGGTRSYYNSDGGYAGQSVRDGLR
jgi:hypothetical protein